MPELRYDLLTGRFAIIATERSKRPSEFGSAQRSHPPKPEYDEKCPFCPGHEKETPPETYALGPESRKPDTPGWLVRVVPNKFPAVVPYASLGDAEKEEFNEMLRYVPTADHESIYWRSPAAGVHEVVIESPKHNATLGSYSVSELKLILDTIRKRAGTLYDDAGTKYVQVFRNWGPDGGASLSHPHFQLIAMPVMPTLVRVEYERVRAYEARTRRCLICDQLARELEKGTRIVYKGAHHAAICPFASLYSYELLILPTDHRTWVGSMSDAELEDLAICIAKVFSRYEEMFSSLSYNIALHSAPETVTPVHWHIHVYPRLTALAGLELGSGTFINPTPPEAAAKQFRGEGA